MKWSSVSNSTHMFASRPGLARLLIHYVCHDSIFFAPPRLRVKILFRFFFPCFPFVRICADSWSWPLVFRRLLRRGRDRSLQGLFHADGVNRKDFGGPLVANDRGILEPFDQMSTNRVSGRCDQCQPQAR